MPQFMIGDWVRVKSIGTGQITGMNLDKVQVRLNPPIDTEIVCRFAQLEILESPQPRQDIPDLVGATHKRHSTIIDIRKSCSAEQQGARLSIDAMRFGLVPTRHLASLTLGYRELEEWINSRLPHTRGNLQSISAVTGPYGIGKSHTMAVVRHVAKEHGYLVAGVEVDGKNFTFADPSRLMAAICAEISGSDLNSSTPITDLYVSAMRFGQPCPSLRVLYETKLCKAFEILRSLNMLGAIDEHASLIEDWLTCSSSSTATQVRDSLVQFESRLPHRINALISNQVSDRPRDFVELLSGLALLAGQAGHLGVVLTVDEFEVEQRQLKPKPYQRVAEVLQELKSFMHREKDHRSSPLAVFVAKIDDSDHIGDIHMNHLLSRDDHGHYPVKTWSRTILEVIPRQIGMLYASAYDVDGLVIEEFIGDISVESLDIRPSEGDAVRKIMTRTVAELDREFGPRSR